MLKVFVAAFCTLVNGISPPEVTLNNGVKMPIVSLGTYGFYNDELKNLVETAVSVGMTGIDTGFNYYNQKSIGEALKHLDRSDAFVITKVAPCFHPAEPPGPKYYISDPVQCANQTRKDVESNFAQLDLETIDLLLLHGPNHHGSGACEEKACELNSVQWAVYEEYLKSGRVRAIGVSNYCPSCLSCITGEDRVVPAVNQIKYHAGMTSDPEGMLTFCEQRGIVPMAYSPLASIIGDKFLQDIGREHNKTSAQVGLKWIADKGYTITTASSNIQHLKEDVDIFSWSLSRSEVESIDAFKTGNDVPSWGCSDPVSVMYM